MLRLLGLVASIVSAVALWAAAPSILALAPNTGVDATPGFAFEVVGADFPRDAWVALSRPGRPDVRATRVTVVSPRQLHVVVDLPDVAEEERWTVTVAGETGTATLRDGLVITLAAVPTITGVYVERAGTWITPALGVAGAAGVRVQVVGTYFGPGGAGASVALTRGERAVPLRDTAWSFDGGRISGTADLPAGEEDRGAWDVTVTSVDGRRGTKSGAFTITGPDLTGVSVDPGILLTPRMVWPTIGATLAMTAAPTPAGAAGVEYRFSARTFNEDTRASETTVLRDFAPEAAFAWTPTVPHPYWVSVTARGADGIAITAPEVYLRFEPADLLGVRLDLTRHEDGSWTLHAAHDGAARDVEYRFALSAPIPDTTPTRYATTPLRGYDADPTVRWTPGPELAGQQVRITVYARTAGSTAAFHKYAMRVQPL